MLLLIANTIAFPLASSPHVHDANNVSKESLSIDQVRIKAEQGNAQAQFSLGVMYTEGEGVVQDDKEAVAWYRKAAEQGYTMAQITLGLMYFIGDGVAENHKEAVKWFSKSAEQGEETAQYYLGVMYDNGYGVIEDNKEAVKWYRKAAEQGHAKAQYLLGTMYAFGRGVPQNDKEAVKWWTKSAEQGDTVAQRSLGVMYADGKGVSQDYKEAIKWTIKSARQGDATAQSNLGFAYANGQGVPQDYKEAGRWYTKAAEQGDAKAQYSLGLMYVTGQGVSQDIKEAVKWLTKAAEQGLAEAQLELGGAYASGQGVIEDYVEAYKWVLLAGMNGMDVTQNKNWLRDHMTAEQIAEGQRLAKEFVDCKEQEQTNGSASANDEGGSIEGFGTGFFISKDGLFLTAAHVVSDAKTVRIYWKSTDYSAEKVFIDESLDVAVLKVAGIESPQPLALSSSSEVKTGDSVFTLGFPQVQLQGIEPKYTDGSISSLSGMGNDPKYFQISVPVQPGNSGGPLLNNEGQVVGLINSRLDDIETLCLTGSIPQNVNYALKSSFILPLLESLRGVTDQLEKSSKLDKAAAIEKTKNAVGLVVCYE